MAFTVTATRVNTSSGTTISPNVTGLSVSQGDGIVLIVRSGGSSLTNITGTWKLEGSSATVGTPFVYIYSRTADSSAEPNPTITFAGSVNASVIAFKITGQWASSFFDTAPSFSTNTGTTTLVSPTITPTTDGCLVVSVAADNNSIVYDAKPAAMTLAQQGLSTTYWLGAAYLTHTTGATGTFSWSFTSGGGNDTTATFAIRAAAEASADTAGSGGGLRISRIRSRRHVVQPKTPIATQALWTGREKNHPAAWHNPTHHVGFTRTLQRVTSIAGFAVDPRKAAPFVAPPGVRVVEFKRRLQRVKLVPAQAAQTFTAQGFPAWGIKRHRIAFERRVQRVVHSVYPATPTVAAQPPSAFAQKTAKTRDHTHRRRVRVVHPPATPLKISTAPPSAFALRKAHRVEYKRSLQVARDAPGKPLPPASTSIASGQPFTVRQIRSRRLRTNVSAVGAWNLQPLTPAVPAQIILGRAFHVEQTRRLLRVPIHNVYPVAPPATAVVSALFQPKPVQQRKTHGRPVLVTGVIVDTKTAPIYPVAVLQLKPFIRHSKRRHQRAVTLGLYQPKPPVADQAVSAFGLKRAFQIERTRTLRRVPTLSFYLTTPSPVVAWTKPKAIRIEYRRTLRVPPKLSQWTATPPRPFTYAALVQNRVRRRAGATQLRRWALLGHYHEAPDVNGIAARSGFGPEIVYLQGEVSEAVYLQTQFSDGVVVITIIRDGDVFI